MDRYFEDGRLINLLVELYIYYLEFLKNDSIEFTGLAADRAKYSYRFLMK